MIALSSNLFAQRTYYKYVPRNSDESKLSDEIETTLDLKVAGRGFSISIRGELSSYSALMGDRIDKDYSGKIIKIGDVEIKYDYTKKIISVGETLINYSSGKMSRVGEYDVLYDYKGNYQGTKKRETNTNW